MSRKFILVPLAVIVTAGVVWASSIITPDKPGFPSLPDGPGTLGYTLTYLFRADGTALNGQKLGGNPSSTYLKNTPCPGGDQVWKGIDASGNPICKGPPLAFAEIIEGTMTVNGIAGKGPRTKLIEGDKIETNNTQTGTIRFANNPAPSSAAVGAGDSIARLGTGTTVLVDRGDTAGTLALITLQDGLLWGRVLTSTGIDFGGGGVIAGVRGTSIALEKVAGQPLVRMVIPHSQKTGNTPTTAAANIRTVYDNDATPLSVRKSIEFNSGATNLTSITKTSRTLQQLYSTWQPARLSPWIAQNTVLDLEYMIAKGKPPGSYIDKEIEKTEPVRGSPDDPCKQNKTLWYDRTYQCVLAYANATTGYDLKWIDKNWEMFAVKNISPSDESFWDGKALGSNPNYSTKFSGDYRYTRHVQDIMQTPSNTSKWYTNNCNPLDGKEQLYCRLLRKYESYDALWVKKLSTFSAGPGTYIAGTRGEYDFVRFVDGYSLASDNDENPDKTINSTNLNINETGKYLTFVSNTTTPLDYLRTGSGGDYSSLAGKTITIELGGTPTSTNGILAQHATSIQVLYSNMTGWTCVGCTIVNSSPNSVSYQLPTTGSTISSFIVGNNLSGTLPIGARINKIIIQ